MMLRKLDGMIEHFTLTNSLNNLMYPNQIQLSVKFKNPKDVEAARKKFNGLFIGLRTKCDGKAFYERTGPEVNKKLPKNITNCIDAAQFASNHSVPVSESLATLFYNDNIVTVTSNHRVCDGTFLKYVVEHCFEDIKNDKKCPASTSNLFKEQFEYIRNHPPKELYSNNETCLIKCKKNEEPIATGLNAIYHEFPIEELKCYDHRLKKPTKITEALWAATSLSLCTLENNFSNYGITTVFDMRKYLKNKSFQWDICDQYTIPVIKAKKHTNDLTIAELGNEFRKHYNTLNDNYGLLAPAPYVHTYPKGVFLILSNLGTIKLHERIDDIVIQATAEGPGKETYLYYLTYSKIKKWIRFSNSF